MGVLYTSCATALRRFELRDGNLGLTDKELRPIHLDRWAVADLEGFSERAGKRLGLFDCVPRVSRRYGALY